MKIGFTGSRKGMTSFQMTSFESLVKDLDDKFGVLEFHHGDCVGADAEAHDMIIHRAWKHEVNINIHPPKVEEYRAFKQNSSPLVKIGKVNPAANYLKRNHKIVDSTDIMIAAPREMIEKRRSGTWATIRYTKKCSKLLYIIYPSGDIHADKLDMGNAM